MKRTNLNLERTTLELVELVGKHEKQTKQFKETAIELNASGAVVNEQATKQT